MIPWTMTETSQVPGEGGAISLHRRGEEFSIRVDGRELMNSRRHGSEEDLAHLACKAIAGLPDSRILIGGLGMGYTLATALKRLAPSATVMVAELVPAVIRWNQKFLGHLAGNPLDDQRVTIIQGDVAQIIAESSQAFDAILLDVDNGPDGLTHKENDRLYQTGGLAAAHKALKPGGALAVWSATKDSSFTKKLSSAGFAVTINKVHARAGNKGARHIIWLAKKK
ncbi:MAG: hypothetical protein JEZ02_14160 [Desulfatibacillum sp.]|nr:hypothetical protein [Desulfatibacillum sp.]